jgi:hypothetical protein
MAEDVEVDDTPLIGSLAFTSFNDATEEGADEKEDGGELRGEEEGEQEEKEEEEEEVEEEEEEEQERIERAAEAAETKRGVDIIEEKVVAVTKKVGDMTEEKTEAPVAESVETAAAGFVAVAPIEELVKRKRGRPKKFNDANESKDKTIDISEQQGVELKGQKAESRVEKGPGPESRGEAAGIGEQERVDTSALANISAPDVLGSTR